MSRDHIKNKVYFESYITKHEQMLNKLLEGLKNADEDKDKARRYISAIAIERYKLIKAKYSCGCELKDVYEQFCDLLEDMPRFWEQDSSMIYIYDMMALAILFGERKEVINSLNELVVKYHRTDALTNLYVNYANEGISSIDGCVSYGKPYERLRDVIINENKTKMLKEYVEKHWYKESKDAFWHDTHKKSNGAYCGYWSFEAGAVAKIARIDDSELREMQYYPYDLVHFKE